MTETTGESDLLHSLTVETPTLITTNAKITPPYRPRIVNMTHKPFVTIMRTEMKSWVPNDTAIAAIFRIDQLMSAESREPKHTRTTAERGSVQISAGHGSLTSHSIQRIPNSAIDRG